MRWIWNAEKDAINRRKHGLSLSIGEVALSDPLALTYVDDHPDGDRWNSICAVNGILLYVVHTWPDGEEDGRIISVRQATRHERKAYEDGEY